jgi:phosphoribosylaminoimidazole-succinocarboxamide synthase
MALQAVIETRLPGLTLFGRGKVRDIYKVDGKLLLVASDRLSAFDVVLPDGIPGKGKVLTQISAFWFQKLADIVPNHMISVDVMDFPPPARSHGEALAESARLPEPIFTPATKEEKGKHDMNIPFATMTDIVGKEMAEKMRAISLEIYRRAADYARGRGIIIADTKFEFGMAEGKLILIDEVLTPDSSRFWPVDGYDPGGPQKSFDKQFVRDYLLTLPWNKTAPGPKLPDEVIENTAEKYREALKILTSRDIE